MTPLAEMELEERVRDIYRKAMTLLAEADIEFLVGGAYAFEKFTGIARHTKDFDIFLTKEGVARALEVLGHNGYRTELLYPHWLGKAYDGEEFVDLIYGAGNGVAVVDDEWFANSVSGEALGMPARLIPAEEMIWSKAFIMERERFDGADIAHVIHARGPQLNWQRLLDRFKPYPRVLLTHLLLFGFIYPDRKENVPKEVLRQLLSVVETEIAASPPQEKICFGTLLSRGQYLTDIGRWGYADARLQPRGAMSAEDIAYWTAAISTEK
jgi:hypothetical protein